MEKILIVYYTGTGSTQLVAEAMSANLTMRNVSAEMHRLTVSTQDALIQKATLCSSLILVFAVHAFNAPDLVYTWLKSLETPTISSQPQTSSKAQSASPSSSQSQSASPSSSLLKKAMIVSVSGGGEMISNTACRVPAKRLLKKKGYSVITEAMVVMPNNWMSATPDDISKALIEIMPKKVDGWLDAFLQNRAVPVMATKPIDRLVTQLGRLEVKGAVQFGKNIKVSDVCNGCGWCQEHCPASNIILASRDDSEVAKPLFGKTCHFCLGCIYGCPQKALTPGKMKFAVIPTGYPLKKYMHQPDKQLTTAELSEQLKGLSWKGVRRYLEV